jgi:putative Mg2+ transporter-C (MgtC) family protein
MADPGAELLIIARVTGAMALAAIIGLEREKATDSAGLRTHMLVAGAAALIAGLGRLAADDFTDERYRELVRVEPFELISAVIAAVGFVGAGAIIKQSDTPAVQGLTTAASLLMVAGIGLAAGLALYVLAAGATVLSLFVLLVLRLVEARLMNRQ